MWGTFLLLWGKPHTHLATRSVRTEVFSEGQGGTREESAQQGRAGLFLMEEGKTEVGFFFPLCNCCSFFHSPLDCAYDRGLKSWKFLV